MKLTAAQSDVLAVLDKEWRGLKVIGEMVNRSPSGVTMSLYALKRMGYVESRNSPKTRRREWRRIPYSVAV